MSTTEHSTGVIELTGQDIQGNPGAATCGHCGRTWDDNHSSALTPTPAGRCPFEYDHPEDEDEDASPSRQLRVGVVS